jgi:single-stranded-DNA-specific exonuclease
MPNHTELIEILLKNRGIPESEYSKFLNPSYEDHLHDPYLLKDMERAVTRIREAIDRQEKIVIYSDYDCDGIPAAVIMNDFFVKIGYENFVVYIPDRHDEGYGLHMDAIGEFIKSGVKLLITFDLGITAVAEVALAQSAGIDVIITDHHLPQETIPNAYAIINHKQADCEYPEEILCGAGLAFKLVQALVLRYGKDWNINEGWEKWLLDMAGLATLADQVPLVGENRVLAYYGLKVLQKTRRPGLVELFRKAGVDMTTMNEEDVTFTLAPRLNAASRMASPMRAFEVLSTVDLAQAKTVADHLAKINDERKHIVATIMKDIKKNIGKRDNGEDKPVIVIGNPKWRVGILGLVASKIVDEYKKPVFVWGSEGSDVIRGSCRGIGDMNLVSAMSALPEGSLLSFGGHLNAGGFSVSHEEVHFLEERLTSVWDNFDWSTVVTEDTSQMIDASITLDDVTMENFSTIEKLAPYGASNPRPVFKLASVMIISVKEFGKDKNHLELIFKNSKNRPVKAISFFKTRESYPARGVLTDGDVVDMLAMFEKSTFAGRTELRLRIVDILPR